MFTRPVLRLAPVLLLGLFALAAWRWLSVPAPTLQPPPPTGVQWFSSWDEGLAEAGRSGRPILLVAAAPHCSGISGVW